MSEVFALGTRAQFIGGTEDLERVASNGGPGTIYYGSASTTTSSSNDGSITAGASHTFRSPTWLVTGGTEARAVIETTPHVDDTHDVHGIEDTTDLVLRSHTAVNVKDHGAVGDGVAEVATTFQAAYDEAVTLGQDVFVPAGTYYVSDASQGAVFQLARDNAGTAPKLRILLEPGTVIKLSTLVPRFIDFNWQANGDTFRAFELDGQGATIDANNIQVGQHVVIGATTDRNLNYDDITIRRIKTKNVWCDPAGGVNNRRFGVRIVSSRADPVTGSTTCRNILVEKFDFQGGDYGVLIGAISPGDPVDHYMDDIVVRDGNHDTLATLDTTFSAGVHVHIGSGGYGDRALIKNVTGSGSRDCGFEINAFQEGVYENCVAKDPLNPAFYQHNFHASPNPAAQVITYRNCQSVTEDRTITATNPCGGWECASATANATGKIVLDTCTYHNKTTGAAGYAGLAIRCEAKGLRHLVLRDFEVVADALSWAPGAEAFPYLLRFVPTVASRLDIDGLRIELAGTLNANAKFLLLYATATSAGSLALDVRRVNVDINTTGGGAVGGLLLGDAHTGGATINGRIEGLRFDRFSGPSGVTAFDIGNAATAVTIGRLWIVGSDLSNLPGGATEINMRTAASWPKCVFRENNWLTNAPFTFASAAAMDLPDTDDMLVVTGTADITSIAAMRRGAKLMLQFSGTAATNGVVDGSNLKLAANLAYTPDDVQALGHDGTNFYEAGRSVN